MAEKETINISEETLIKIINEPATQELLKSALKEAIAKSIADSFRYGDLNRALDKKIKEVLVPEIENFNLSKYIPKLDTILTDIVNGTTLEENKTILNNFKSLMIEPDKKTISLEDIFKEYCKHMEKNVNTYGLEVTFDSGKPEYESVLCKCVTEETSSSYSGYERYDIAFVTEMPDESTSDDDQFVISLSRWRKDPEDEGYRFIFNREPTVDSLRHMNDFEIFLLRLERAGVKIIDIECFEEDVTPEEKPEPTFE